MSLTDVLSVVAVIVCHAGHGTALFALSRGVPLVWVPGIGRDQIPIAQRVAEFGLGIALLNTQSPTDIGNAVSTILGDPSFGARTAAFKAQFADYAASPELPRR